MPDLRKRIGLSLTRLLGALGLIRTPDPRWDQPSDDVDQTASQEPAGDGGYVDDTLAGIWVQDQQFRWHRSTDFDGYTHDLACGLTLAAGDDTHDVQLDTDRPPTSPAETGSICDACDRIRRQHDPSTAD